MEKRGLQSEIVSLPHNTEAYWIGSKNAKNVLVYYHGSSNHPRPSARYRDPCRTRSIDQPRRKKLKKLI